MANTTGTGRPATEIPALSWGRILIVCLWACLTAPIFPAYAQIPSKLLKQVSGTRTTPQSTINLARNEEHTLETISRKLAEVQIRHQDVRSALAAKNPPSYASFDELSARQILLFTTQIALENWLSALKNIQKSQQAERDLESKIQSWSGFGVDEPYPLSLADQLAAEVRSRYLQLQTEQARTSLEEDQIPGYRRATELAGPEVRKRAEAFEKALDKNEARLRWQLGSAKDEQEMAESRLQAALAKVALNKQQVYLLEREIDFLEEKLQQTLGKTDFSREDLDSRLKTIAKKRVGLQKQLTEAEHLNIQAQEQVTNARASLGKDLAAEGQNQERFRQLFELRQIEAETLSQRVETLKLLLASNSLETILWQERFRVYEGLKKNQDLAEVIRNLDAWRERISEFNDYYTSKALLTRTQIQTQNESLHNWPEQKPGKRIEQAKREAYQARMNDLEQLIASTETLDFLTVRLRVETSAKKGLQSLLERLQIALAITTRRVSSIWNYEVFSIDDTIVVDGKVISGSRSITLKKLIYGLLLLTVGIWAVGRVSKILSQFALRRFKVERSLVLLFEKIGYCIAALTVILLALGLVQIPVTAFAFLGGALAIGVGFGGQNLINNFMSSLILLMEKPIKIGDVVEAEGVLGRVTAIGGRCSTIRRFDGVDLLIPNSLLLEKPLVNRTLSDNLVRYDVKVGVAYGSPTREVFHILEQVMDEHGLVLKDPKPVVLLEDFSADSLLFGIYYWIEVNDRLDVRSIASNLRHRIDRLFRDAGINIAFPQRDVHLDTEHPLRIQLIAEQQAKEEAVKGETSPASHEKTHLPGN